MLNDELGVHRCGLTTSAFNMLPVGCLDGGRAMQVAALFVHCFNFVYFFSFMSIKVQDGDLTQKQYIYRISLECITSVSNLN